MPKNMSKDIKTEIPGRDDNDSLSAGNQTENEKSGVVAGGCNSETDAQDETPGLEVPEDDSDIDEPMFYDSIYGGKTLYFNLVTQEEQALSMGRSATRLSRAMTRARMNKAGSGSCKN